MPGALRPDAIDPASVSDADPCSPAADTDAPRAAAGSGDPLVRDWLVDDVARALDPPDGLSRADRDGRVRAVLAAMDDIALPGAAGGLFGMQMVAVHAAAMGCLHRAVAPVAAAEPAGHAARIRDAELRHAVRLLGLFRRQLRDRDGRADRAASDAEDAPVRYYVVHSPIPRRPGDNDWNGDAPGGQPGT
jgi:hypothetical protein